MTKVTDILATIQYQIDCPNLIEAIDNNTIGSLIDQNKLPIDWRFVAIGGSATKENRVLHFEITRCPRQSEVQKVYMYLHNIGIELKWQNQHTLSQS